jgi:hypothetical protein
MSRKVTVLDRQTGPYEIWLFVLFVVLHLIFMYRFYLSDDEPPSLYTVNLYCMQCRI